MPPSPTLPALRGRSVPAMDQRLTVRLPDEQFRALRDLAARSGATTATLARHLLAERVAALRGEV